MVIDINIPFIKKLQQYMLRLIMWKTIKTIVFVNVKQD